MDQTVTQQDHKRLRVPEIAEELSVTARTVYTMIDKEGWAKEVGHRNRVWYHVPVSFIEEYKQLAQADQTGSQQSMQNTSRLYSVPSQYDQESISQQRSETTVTFTDEQFALIIGDKDTRINELKDTITEKDSLIDELRAKLELSQNRVSRLEGEMSGKLETIKQLEARLSETIAAKDETIAAKDQAINAANAAVMLMEQQKSPTLDTSTVEPARQIESKPTGWWDRLMGRG